MKQRNLYQLSGFITITIFLSAIFIPLLVGVFSTDQLVSKFEKRALIQTPARPADLDDIRKYPESFEAFYSDQFGLREWLSRTYSLTKFLLGDSPSENVTVGKNGWLFLGSVKNKKNRGVIDDVRNINLYTGQDLSEFAMYITGLNAWLNEKNVQYVFVIAPNKHSIYFDQMPNYINKVNAESATDQLIEYLKSHTPVSVVDLREIFIEEKVRAQLYFKTDSHWNHNGANIAQYVIMKEIEKPFPEKIEPELFNLKEAVSVGGDLQRLMGFDVFTEQNPSPVFDDACLPEKSPYKDKENNLFTATYKGQALRAIVFGDSFFHALEPYFLRKFGYTKFQSGISNYSSLSNYLETDMPDMVIEEWVERNLPHVPKSNDHFVKALIRYSFQESLKVVFSIADAKLKFNKWLEPIGSENEGLRFQVTGADPIIIFPPLSFKPDGEYVLHINIESSVDTVSQVFYSDADQIDQSFSEKNSLGFEINEGENDLFIHLKHPNLGARLRLDPVSDVGEITINSLGIKR